MPACLAVRLRVSLPPTDDGCAAPVSKCAPANLRATALLHNFAALQWMPQMQKLSRKMQCNVLSVMFGSKVHERAATE